MSRPKGPLPFAVDFSSLKAAAPSLRRPLVLVVHNQDTMALLWNPESWSQRLAELEARSGELKEAPLRRDVRSLGTLLGEVLREQAGEDLFAHVEALRQGTIQRRDAEARGDEKEAALQGAKALELVHSLPAGAGDSADAGVCVLFRADQPGGDEPSQAAAHCAATERRKGTAARVAGRNSVRDAKRVGISADEAMDWLRRILIVPVFTAHPTEVARRSVMFKRRTDR